MALLRHIFPPFDIHALMRDEERERLAVACWAPDKRTFAAAREWAGAVRERETAAARNVERTAAPTVVVLLNRILRKIFLPTSLFFNM